MINRFYIFALLSMFTAVSIQAQSLFSEKQNFTRQDTLRGSITPERSWWDLAYYHLDIKVNPDEKYISGKNTIQYKVLKNNSVMQIDLQAPMKITKVIQNEKELYVTVIFYI